jgi:glycosyltransferase involved in cell wall biosynthesis
MRLLVDALSVNNLSGRHVLAGHVREIAAQSPDTKITMLVSAANEASFEDLPPGVERHQAPIGGDWLARVAWQWRHGGRLCKELGVDLVFSPSGMLSSGMARPQVVLAQNPWPLLARSEPPAAAMKSLLQRRAFARAQARAAVMAFNSLHMQALYEQHFGARRTASVIAHQGIEEALFAAGSRFVADGNRAPMVLCVSVMARHKAVEVLVGAFERVRRQVCGASLVLVGGWPDAAYRAEVEALVSKLELGAAVRIAGHVPEPELHALYGSARVFCLTSRCESFGIPAIEAQAFGTPSVVAGSTAAPEIVGNGGVAVPQDDVDATSEALLCHFGADHDWRRRSREARANAERFHWQGCSTPLVDAIEKLGRRVRGA